jgi:hypothetical protein
MSRAYSRKHPWRKSWQIMRGIEGIYRHLYNYYFPRKISEEKREEKKGLESQFDKNSSCGL